LGGRFPVLQFFHVRRQLVDCVRCKASNPDDKKFCGDCGMPLDPALSQLSEIVEHAVDKQLQAALDSRLKDSKVVQVETAEAIEERLTNWAKFYVGIPAAILAVVLALFGISKFSDFANLIEGEEGGPGESFARKTERD
jgi:hypothetical protein